MPQESTFKPVTEAVKQAVKDVGSQIQGLGNDITGKIRQTFDEDIEELVSWGETVFGRVKQTFAPFLSSISQWFLQTEFAKKSSVFLKKILNIESRREKRERMQQGIKRKGLLMDILRGLGMFFGLAMGGAPALLGAILAPIIGPIIKPLEILGKAFNTFKLRIIGIVKWIRQFAKDPFGLGEFRIKGTGPMRKILNFFTKVRNMIPPKLLSMAETGLSWIGKVFRWIGKAGGFVMKIGGAKLLGKFMWGLNKIFWPLQVIISAIEFVKGFMSTEGDLIDKWIGGVKAVIKEFFGIPISLLGKLIDWTAEKFGIENLGVEKMLTDGFNNLVDVFASIPIWFKDLFKGWIMDSIEWAKKNVSFMDIGKSISDFFTNLFDTIMSGLYALIKKIPGLEWLAKQSEMGTKFMDTLESSAKRAEEREMTEYEKKRLEQEEKKLKMANKQGGGDTIVVQSNDNSTNTGAPPADTRAGKEVDSSVDSWGMGFASDKRLKKDIEYLGGK